MNLNVLTEAKVERKLALLGENLQDLLRGVVKAIPACPARDVEVLATRKLPEKNGLSFVDGQARLLHDLASIELQAMELGLRTLSEFPQAPAKFCQRLAEITAEEGEHLALCLRALEEMNFPWGSFPTHIGLWGCVNEKDSLLDRIAIVHRYLEGSGLDASATILRRLTGVKANAAEKVVRVIRRDEMSHVQFGSDWYHSLAREAGLDPSEDFAQRITSLAHRIPRRLEPLNVETRREAGFTDREIEALASLRSRFLNADASE